MFYNFYYVKCITKYSYFSYLFRFFMHGLSYHILSNYSIREFVHKFSALFNSYTLAERKLYLNTM